jgi:hypothetical protein
MALLRAMDRAAHRRRASGCGFDSTVMRPRIQLVRSDYVMEIQSREHDLHYQRFLLKSARETVVKLAFFQQHSVEM